MELEKYKSLNNSFKSELVFNLGATSGFYSEFNNMVMAMAYCLNMHIRFVLSSENANFRYEKGWEDFFVPFCEERNGTFYKKYNLRDRNPFFEMGGFFQKLSYFSWRMFHRHTYLTHDIFSDIRSVSFVRSRFNCPELGIENMDLRHICREIIDMIYLFNAPTRKEVDLLTEKVGLPDSYIGIHVRGGDKSTETDIVDCSEYMNLVKEKGKGIKNIFVSTDDYTVFEYLTANYKDYKFYTLTSESERGYYYDSFVKRTSEDKKSDMIKLFASIELLRKSDVFIGTFSSNMGMFIGMCKDEAYGVDYGEWIVW